MTERTKDDVPGEISFWLTRATLDELISARMDEVEKGMTARWRLVVLIDEELHHRDTILRKALSS